MQRVKCRAVVFQLFFIACKRVEIDQVVLFVKELLRIVLAVDVDEPSPQLFKRRHTHRPPVYAADIFPVRVNFTLHLQFLRVKFHLILGKPAAFRNLRKNRAHKRAASTGPDDVSVRALAQNGRDRVNDDGFTGTCFTGQNVEAALEENFRLLDDGDIFNMQNAQHGRFSFRQFLGAGSMGRDLAADLRADTGRRGSVPQNDHARIVAAQRPDHLGKV